MTSETSSNAPRNRLFCFGLGFSARALIERLDRRDWQIAGTVRDAEAADRWHSDGVEALIFDGKAQTPGIEEAIAGATHILISVPPDAPPPEGLGDPVLAHYAMALSHAANLNWVGYLSTVGVYGDHDGGWVDETTRAAPVSRRSHHRRAAEMAWEAFSAETGKRVIIFRLAGIYGPGRSALENVMKGRARRIIKPGQRFNRIHVEDIARVVLASMVGHGTAPILNVSDDLPAPPQDVIALAAELMGVPLPPEVAFDDADLSAMAKSFYGENKQVRNDLLKSDLGLTLRYATYKEGLQSLARGLKNKSS
ncbi:MAG: SDR family oxidoreductase [Hyphomicrobiaceae bacterium]|nr:SDR family oxidoreductase [Hyphomicrobiaceae bacterium]MCC0010668.1 SDR family oxidoreductase [Hyphomicrobiaceae bacterium]